MSPLPGVPGEVLVALATGLMSLPAVILSHRSGMRSAANAADARFDDLMQSALQQRDQTIKDLSASQNDTNRLLGAAQAQISLLQTEQSARDGRERDLMRQIGAMEHQFNSCLGGSPCPFRRPA